MLRNSWKICTAKWTETHLCNTQMLKIILNWHINAKKQLGQNVTNNSASKDDRLFFGNYNSKDDLYESSSGLLVEALDVPPLALLDRCVHKNLEEGEAHFLFFKSPHEDIFISLLYILLLTHISAYLWPTTYRNKLLCCVGDKIN